MESNICTTRVSDHTDFVPCGASAVGVWDARPFCIEHAPYLYVAASWSNPDQPRVVEWFRRAGYKVYDFRNPAPGNTGFSWSSIDPRWQTWSKLEFCEALPHPIAQAGFALDEAALLKSDGCVLLLRSGNDAHLEVGFAAGYYRALRRVYQKSTGRTAVVLSEDFTPGLMYKLLDHVCLNVAEVVDAFARTLESK